MDSPFHNPWNIREYVFLQKQNSIQMSQMNLYKAEMIANSASAVQSDENEMSDELVHMLADQVNYTDNNLQSHILYHGIPIDKENTGSGMITPHEEIHHGLSILDQTFPFYKTVITGDNSMVSINGAAVFNLFMLLLSYLSFHHWRSVTPTESDGMVSKFLSYLKHRDQILILSEEEKDWSFFNISVQTKYSDDQLHITYSDSLETSLNHFDEMLGQSRRAYFYWILQQMGGTVSDHVTSHKEIRIRIPIQTPVDKK